MCVCLCVCVSALSDECSNIKGTVQKTEAPQKPRKADEERSKIHHYIYIYKNRVLKNVS